MATGKYMGDAQIRRKRTSTHEWVHEGHHEWTHERTHECAHESAHDSTQGPLNGGVSNGGVSRSGLVLSFLGLSRFFWDFPDLLGDGPGIFPICPFPLFSLLRAPTRNSPERVRDTIWTFPEKSVRGFQRGVFVRGGKSQ